MEIRKLTNDYSIFQAFNNFAMLAYSVSIPSITLSDRGLHIPRLISNQYIIIKNGKMGSIRSKCGWCESLDTDTFIIVKAATHYEIHCNKCDAYYTCPPDIRFEQV